MRDDKCVHVKYVPGTYRAAANKDNDYLINREAQKAGRTFSGVEGIGMQDASLQESMGPVGGRTKETWGWTAMGSAWRGIACCVPSRRWSTREWPLRAWTSCIRRSAPPRWCCRRT